MWLYLPPNCGDFWIKVTGLLEHGKHYSIFGKKWEEKGDDLIYIYLRHTYNVW